MDLTLAKAGYLPIPARVLLAYCGGLFLAAANIGAAESREFTVMVQPIVVARDDGSDQAPCHIDEELLDELFASSQVDLHVLDARLLRDTKSRDGARSLDEVSAIGQDRRLSRGPRQIISVYFLTTIDNQQPAYKLHGKDRIEIFIAQGDQPSDGKAEQLLARAITEGLGFRELPATQEERQRQPLVRPHVHCLSLEEAKQLVLDESYEPYFSKLQRREIGAITAAPVMCDNIVACQDEARQRFSAMLLPFSDREAESLAALVEYLEQQLGDRYPLFARHPWRFIKMDNDLCGGFPHTRGDCILLSARVVEGITSERHTDVSAPGAGRFASLLVHEQMHVYQRFYPDRFAKLAEEVFRLVRADVVDHPWLVERQIQNPDALQLEWLIPWMDEQGEREFWWPRTILAGDSDVPRMGRDFQPIAVRVTPREGVYHVVLNNDGIPDSRPLQTFAGFFGTFEVGVGQDHPHEIAAYASAQLLSNTNPTTTGEANSPEVDHPSMNDRFLLWCQQHLQ